MLSAETDRRGEISSSDIIANKLKTKHEHQRLQPSKIYEVNKDVTIDGCLNETEGIKQLLLAVVRSGNEYYSIVLAHGSDQDNVDTQATIVTRHIDGKRAEICSIVDDNQPVVIGNENFAILDTDKTLYIAGMNMTGGHIFTAINQYETVDDSIGGIGFWSAESSVVRTVLDSKSTLSPAL